LGSIQVTKGTQSPVTLGGTISQISLNDTTHFKDDNGTLYNKLNNGDLEIIPQLGGRLIIEGFNEGDLGLTLGGFQTTPTNNTFNVDINAIPGGYDFQSAADRQQHGWYGKKNEGSQLSNWWVSPNANIGSVNTETIYTTGFPLTFVPGISQQEFLDDYLFQMVTGYTDSIVFGDGEDDRIELDMAYSDRLAA
jgi:hypothetical protein